MSQVEEKKIREKSAAVYDKRWEVRRSWTAAEAGYWKKKEQGKRLGGGACLTLAG